MMTLFYSPGSCALAPHIALCESGLPFSIDEVNFSNRTCSVGNYYDVNAKGSVPALKLEDGKVLTECAVLLQYIADKSPGKNLIPAPGNFERYKTLEALNFVATELHKGCNPYWYADDWHSNKSASTELKNQVRKALGRPLEFASEQIQKTGFLAGRSFTVADIYLFTVLSWHSHLDLNLSDWPVLNHYYKTMLERPAVKAAMKAEGLI